MREVSVICGPTAAGKSALALALAAHSGAMLISADSRQVYRRFDVGTAKPSGAEQDAVMHRGIDLVEPTQRYSAAEWCAVAMKAVAEADRRNQPVVVVGGTGFYLRALDEPLFDSPPLDPVRRAELQAELAAVPTDVLRHRCESIDPPRAHLGRTQLLRAIEVQVLTGRPLSLWMTERARPSNIRARYLLVDPGAALRNRIEARVEAMLDAGWESEVATLASEVPMDAPAWNACGYANLHAAMQGAITRSAAIERTVIDTRQYAKRQRTWFRHQLPAERTTLLDPAAADTMSRAAGWFESASLSEHL